VTLSILAITDHSAGFLSACSAKVEAQPPKRFEACEFFKVRCVSINESHTCGDQHRFFESLQNGSYASLQLTLDLTHPEVTTCVAALPQEMNFTFSNILGSPYRGGSLVLHGDTLICPAGNRVREVSLREATSLTLPIQAPHQLQAIALSPDGSLLIAVDTAARALLIVRHTHVLLHRWTLKAACRCAQFSPDGAYIALAVGKLLQERPFV
jgi:hypothetical protein